MPLTPPLAAALVFALVATAAAVSIDDAASSLAAPGNEGAALNEPLAPMSAPAGSAVDFELVDEPTLIPATDGPVRVDLPSLPDADHRALPTAPPDIVPDGAALPDGDRLSGIDAQALR